MTDRDEPQYSAALADFAHQLLTLAGNLQVMVRVWRAAPPGELPALERCARQLLEMTLCRAIERFEGYALTRVEAVFEHDLGHALERTEGKVTLRELAELARAPDLEGVRGGLRRLAGASVAERGLLGLNDYFTQALRVPLISANSLLFIALFTEARNVLVHHNGVWDEQSVKRLKRYGMEIQAGERFETEVMMVSVLNLSLFENARGCDARLGEVYGLPRMHTEVEIQALKREYSLLEGAQEPRPREGWTPSPDSPFSLLELLERWTTPQRKPQM